MQIAPQTPLLLAAGGPAVSIPGGFAELLAALGLGGGVATPAASAAGAMPAVQSAKVAGRPSACAKVAAGDDTPQPVDLALSANGGLSAAALANAMPAPSADPGAAQAAAATTPARVAASVAAAQGVAVATPAQVAGGAAPVPEQPSPTAPTPGSPVGAATVAPAAVGAVSESVVDEETSAAFPTTVARLAADPVGTTAARIGLGTGTGSGDAATPASEVMRTSAAGGQPRRSRAADRFGTEGGQTTGAIDPAAASVVQTKVERTRAAGGLAADMPESVAAAVDPAAPVPTAEPSADATLPMTEADPLPATAAGSDVAAPAAAPIPAASMVTPPAAQVALHLSRQPSGGETLVVSLSPEELGTVEIEIELDDNGHARAHIAAELPSTLELIQRDASLLEQALESAGLDLAPDALTFDLRRDGQASQQRHDAPRASWPVAGGSAGPDPTPLPTVRSSRLLDLQV